MMPPKTLKEIYEECVLCAKKLSWPTVIENGTKLYKWSGSVAGSGSSFMLSELTFSYTPYFGLSVADSTASLPCILICPDATAAPSISLKLLNLFAAGHTILFRNPQFAVEVVVTAGGDKKEFSLVHLLLQVDKLHILEEKVKKKRPRLEICVVDHTTTTQEEVLYFVPLKVSYPILTSTKSPQVLCLVLARVLLLLPPPPPPPPAGANSADLPKLVWLILRNNQAMYSCLLTPDVPYIIRTPATANLPANYFRRYSSFLNIASSHLDVSFQQILHHKELAKTNAAIWVPENSRISTVAAVNVSKLQIPTSTQWYSVSDERIPSFQFVSIFGIIKKVAYFGSRNQANYCPWCCSGGSGDIGGGGGGGSSSSSSSSSSNENSKIDDVHKREREAGNSGQIVDSFFQNINNLLVNDGEFPFPEVTCEIQKDEKLTGFGIRGGKVTVEISLQSTTTRSPDHKDGGGVRCLYFKRWQQEQYPAGLVPGLKVCFTDVNVKLSKKKNLYFISTPFTRVIHLDVCNDNSLRELPPTVTTCQLFGCPNTFRNPANVKLWGILDLDFLARVSIIAKCKLCCQSFNAFRCSNIFCPYSKMKMNTDYQVEAVARVFVRGMQNFEASCLFLKNENVQKYLCLPDKVWKCFCNISADRELTYYGGGCTEELQLLNYVQQLSNVESYLHTFFRAYCKFHRPRTRFHFFCKKFKGEGAGPDGGNRFYCTSLEEVSAERVEITRSLVFST